MKLVALALVAITAAPALAQSKRYPPEPVDKDELEAQQSRLWDQAMNPAQVPYRVLVTDAQKLLSENRTDPTREALEKLADAIALLPSEAEAYRLRGDGHMSLQDWGKCASDYEAAWARTKTDDQDKAAYELRRRLGLCQARDNRLADAERTLAETAATGVNSVEIWMRLGEVRIAMGKLEGAIAALGAALQQTDSHALVKWLLAGAYDRARQPSEARLMALEALNADKGMTTLRAPTFPLLGSGEHHFLMGLGFEASDPPRPELALVQFRRFLKLSPDSPWRKRAEDHVRELRTARLPDTVERLTGNAAYDERQMRDSVRRGMPAMRACLAKTPFLVLSVQITKRGPKGPENARWRALPEAVDVRSEDMHDTSRAEADAAIRCVEPLAKKLALPKPKEKETYYKVQFRVVGP